MQNLKYFNSNYLHRNYFADHYWYESALSIIIDVAVGLTAPVRQFSKLRHKFVR